MSWDLSVLGRLLLASALGGLIGIEREVHGRSAGLRTQMLVALGSALAMVVSLEFGRVFGAPGASGTLRVDPGRIAYGVMVGVGFLGAGAILHDRGGIRGLTTAASVWCTAAVGLASGFGMYFAAAAATAIVLVTLRVVRALEERLPQHQQRRLTVVVPGAAGGAVDRFRNHLRGMGMRVVDVRVRRDLARDLTRVDLDIRLPTTAEHDRLLGLLDAFPDVREIRIE